MAGFLKGLFGKSGAEEKLDLATVGRRKTLTLKEQEFLRNEAEKSRVPAVPSRSSESYRRRTPKGREDARKARMKALTAIQARYRGNKSRKNTKMLKKHTKTMQTKLAKIDYDNDEAPSVAELRKRFENKKGGRRTRKRRRKTKRKGRRKTKKRRKMRKRKTRRKR